MNSTNLPIPIFPLSVFLLPEGITRLRIFEQRYLKLVKIALKNNGFVLCLPEINKGDQNDEAEPMIKWGSWVEIINFAEGDDGVLEIDVKCKALVQILSMTNDEDNLCFGKINVIQHWPEHSLNKTNNALLHSLQAVFNESPLLKSLYTNNMQNNTAWIVARWLEILPTSLDVKRLFSSADSFETAEEFVNSIVSSELTN
jgi:hypothetical protein